MRKTLLALVLVPVLSTFAFADSSFSFSIGFHPSYRHHRYSHRGHAVVRYYRPPVVVHQPRVVVVQRPVGHWEWRDVQVWVPGHSGRVWVPPRYETVFVAGHMTVQGTWIEGHHETRLAAQGYYRDEWRPGYYRTERRQVWVTY